MEGVQVRLRMGSSGERDKKVPKGRSGICGTAQTVLWAVLPLSRSWLGNSGSVAQVYSILGLDCKNIDHLLDWFS